MSHCHTMAINITDLDISQLADVKKQLDDVCLSLSLIFYYLTLYRNSLTSLPLLPNSGRLRQSLNPAFTTSATSPPKTSVFLLIFFFTISTTHPSIDKTILVPLTNSLYVPGHLSDPDHVIVDVGTGYFVKKVPFFYNSLPSFLASSHTQPFPQTCPQAVTYYNEKVDYLESNLSSLEDLITKKRDNHNYVVSLLQAKIQAQVEAKS